MSKLARGILILVHRELTRSRIRTIALVLTIGATLSTVLVLEGFQSGLIIQMREMVLSRGADLIAVQPGITSFLASRSKLPQVAREEVEAVDGVRNAEPMVFVPVIFEHRGRKTPIVLLVHERKGGPRRLRAGRLAVAPGEAVVDVSLAAMHSLVPGDTMTVSDYELEVVGLSEGEAAMFTPVVFISYDDLLDLYFESDIMGDIVSLPLVGFLLVELAVGADPREVQARIERSARSVDVLIPRELADNEARLGRALFGPVLSVLTFVAYLVCLMVIGLVTYANASARARTYGVLMALGFRRGQLLLALALEGIGLTALALPVGLAIAIAVGTAVEAWSPLYLIEITERGPLLRSMAAAFALAVLGTGLALGPVGRLDPALAFRR